MIHCPQCGNESETFREGVCEDCHDENQTWLDEFNASFDRWEGLSDHQREVEIRRAMR